ncbi:hypothetical protein [Paenibacillus andongensis]|uniref:hypothetical protein n=1 Tax=Paenibacillus andongensis TaxID=2975482 RepID=UPI0021BBA4F9|nr:hypothetical protein [Paenibacillus andongensis]
MKFDAGKAANGIAKPNWSEINCMLYIKWFSRRPERVAGGKKVVDIHHTQQGYVEQFLKPFAAIDNLDKQ